MRSRGMDSRLTRGTRVYTVVCAALEGGASELTEFQLRTIRAILDRHADAKSVSRHFTNRALHVSWEPSSETFTVARPQGRAIARFPSLIAAMEAFPGAVVTHRAERAARRIAEITAGRPQPELDYLGEVRGQR